MHRIHNNFWREPKEFAIPPTLCSRAQKKKNRFKKNDSHGKMIGSCACQLSSEVTPYHSGSLSHHWGHRRVLLALLPAWAGAPIIIHQDITAYAELPLWSAHLVRASHQRGQKDMRRAHTLHQPASTWMTGRRNPSQLSGRWKWNVKTDGACPNLFNVQIWRTALGIGFHSWKNFTPRNKLATDWLVVQKIVYTSRFVRVILAQGPC